MSGRGRTAVGFLVLGVGLLCAMLVQGYLGEDRWCYVSNAERMAACSRIWPLLLAVFGIGGIASFVIGVCFAIGAWLGRRTIPADR